MIKRYSNKEMNEIWNEENKFKCFLDVEIATVEAWVKLGKIPEEDYIKIKKNASFNLKEIHNLEKELKHDVIAFTRSVSNSLGDEKKWIHYGLTSTDVVDTAYALQIKSANKIIMNDLNELKKVLMNQALRYKNTPIIGRTHGVHADITSFGLKWLLWYEEIKRNISRFNNASKLMETGKISGAVGNYANVDPKIQDIVCNELKISSSNISTQILQRDRHAEYIWSISMIANTIEKIATEIRHFQRTEVREVFEFFDKNQKGSSAMPHKKNPISSENVSGISRVIRGYLVTAMENNNLWHERDISHSSAERIIIPDATTLINYILKRYTKTLSNLIIDEEKMEKNIWSTNGVIFSQQVMNKLILEKGLSREEAYDLIQPIALYSFENDQDFLDNLLKNKKLLELIKEDELKEVFNLKDSLKEIDFIYKKVIDNGF